MMVKILFYAYCVGMPSSRKIAKGLVDNVALRWLAAGNTLDFRTISDFPRRNPLPNPAVGIFISMRRNQPFDQSVVACRLGCFSLAKRNDLVLAAGLFQGMDGPVAEPVTPVIAAGTIAALRVLPCLQTRQQPVCKSVPG
jgi:hypothetical protein